VIKTVTHEDVTKGAKLGGAATHTHDSSGVGQFSLAHGDVECLQMIRELLGLSAAE